MSKKVKLKTAENKASVASFVKSIKDEGLRKDSETLLRLFKKVTGKQPKMWGKSIVGFGKYTYQRANGDEGEFMATGFSPRKSGPTLYIMPGYNDYGHLLKKIGIDYKLGKSCLYLKSLEGANLEALAELIRLGLKDLKKNHKTDY